jgi:hypothetical protein
VRWPVKGYMKSIFVLHRVLHPRAHTWTLIWSWSTDRSLFFFGSCWYELSKMIFTLDTAVRLITQVFFCTKEQFKIPDRVGRGMKCGRRDRPSGRLSEKLMIWIHAVAFLLIHIAKWSIGEFNPLRLKLFRQSLDFVKYRKRWFYSRFCENTTVSFSNLPRAFTNCSTLKWNIFPSRREVAWQHGQIQSLFRILNRSSIIVVSFWLFWGCLNN